MTDHLKLILTPFYCYYGSIFSVTDACDHNNLMVAESPRNAKRVAGILTCHLRPHHNDLMVAESPRNAKRVAGILTCHLRPHHNDLMVAESPLNVCVCLCLYACSIKYNET